MSQPKWKMVANLGDVNPFDYGGYFVFIDETGVYEAEAVWLELIDPESDDTLYEVRRFVLDRCTYADGVLSDNKFHPEHAAWFASPESERASRPQDTTYLSRIATYYGMDLDELIRLFCSDDPIERAEAYRMVGEYHGWDNLDSYPTTYTRAEAQRTFS